MHNNVSYQVIRVKYYAEGSVFKIPANGDALNLYVRVYQVVRIYHPGRLPECSDPELTWAAGVNFYKLTNKLRNIFKDLDCFFRKSKYFRDIMFIRILLIQIF